MNDFFDYVISAIGEKVDEKVIEKALKAIGLDQIIVETHLNFDAYIESLPDRSIEGFTDACDNWARHYGMGGGDISTENLFRQICEDDTSNNPRVLALAFYNAVAGHSKKSFEAATLIADCISTALEETEADGADTLE